MPNNLKSFAFVALALLSFSSCRKEPVDPTVEPLEVPDTYSFENISFSGQTERLNQLEEMVTYMKTSNQMGVQLDKAVLNAMFANTNGDANGNFSFSSEKDIKSKTFEPHLTIFDGYFNDIVAASQSMDTGSNGVAGVLFSADGTESRLHDAQGFEPVQLIEKILMGALMYYQATGVYLEDEKMNVDNKSVVEGEGTAMQHHWDEAYGYLGVSIDFPDNTEDVRFWGKYCVGRDALLGTNERLSLAFLIGRAAITEDRLDERDSAIADVRKEWENVCAGTAIHYINQGINNIGDDYVRNHALSEAVAFTYSLFYNPERRITEAQIDEVINLIGDNLYEVSTTDLQASRDLLAGIYGWESIKSAL